MKATGGQRVDCLVGQAPDIEVGQDLGGDLVGDGLLDGRVSGQRGDGADLAVGVGDLVAGPHRHPGQWRQHTPPARSTPRPGSCASVAAPQTGAGHAALDAGHTGVLGHGLTIPGQQC